MKKILCIFDRLYRLPEQTPFPWLIVFLVTAFWFLAWLWCRPLMLPDEGRYVGVAWEMLRSGEFWTPTLNSLPYFHKPPLLYWLTSLSLSVFGMHEWAARLPSLSGALLGCGAVYFLVRRWQHPRTANVLYGLMLVQPLIFLGAQYANLDMLVAGCISATICTLAYACLSHAAGLLHQRALALAYFFAGLGFLAKGLIGLVLPAAVILLWLATLRQWRMMWLLFRSKMGWILLAVTALPWPLVMQWRYHEFFHYFIVVQHFDRFAGGGFNNVHPWWFYLVVLMIAALPFWPRIMAQTLSGSLKNNTPFSPLRRLMWIWVLWVTLFFSLPQSKLLGYIFPVAFPLCYLAADAYVLAQEQFRDVRRQHRWRIATGILAVLCVLVAVIPGFFPPEDERGLAEVLRSGRKVGEPVYFLEDYYFSLPFYAQLQTPVTVVTDWRNPDMRRFDNWHNELADAGHFDTPQAEKVLLQRSALPRVLCAQPISWVVMNLGSEKQYPFLQGQVPQAVQKDNGVWKINTKDPQTAIVLGCVPPIPFFRQPEDRA